jgi:hypothetical protein
VPVGISFLGEGTITVNLPFLYFWWLPRWDTSLNPNLRRVLIIWADDNSLDMNPRFTHQGFLNGCYCVQCFFILEIKH